MIRILCSLFCADTCSSCCTVVSVCYIECVDLGREDLSDSCDGSIVIDYPESVTEAVLICERILRCSCSVAGYDFVQLLVIFVCEEYRLDVGVLNLHMNHTVVFLVFTCKLMLLYLSFRIVISVSAKNKSVLCAAVHGLCIYIVARFAVLYQPAFSLPLLEVLHSLIVNLRVVIWKDRIEVDFRFGDMQKGFLPSHFLSLF